MSTSDKQWVFLQDLALLIHKAQELGYKLTGGELWRPDEMQKIYLENGKSKAKRSYHQDKLAIDLNLFVNGEIQWSNNVYWKQLGDFWESLRPENRWGGNFTKIDDPFHFERML